MKAKLLVLGALAVAALTSSAAQSPNSLAGKKAPALTVQNWANTNGKTLSLAKLRGKVVVLDFWAFW
jgi:cytochrome oxidase Cu insertion factor (SCO1/SenC/PrrC family)